LHHKHGNERQENSSTSWKNELIEEEKHHVVFAFWKQPQERVLDAA
jgi:hypothetical protein